MNRDQEAYDVLTDLTRAPRDAILAAARLTRRMSAINADFVLGMGFRFRAIKQDQRFDADQLARWADDGGR